MPSVQLVRSTNCLVRDEERRKSLRVPQSGLNRRSHAIDPIQDPLSAHRSVNKLEGTGTIGNIENLMAVIGAFSERQLLILTS